MMSFVEGVLVSKIVCDYRGPDVVMSGGFSLCPGCGMRMHNPNVGVPDAAVTHTANVRLRPQPVDNPVDSAEIPGAETCQTPTETVELDTFYRYGLNGEVILSYRAERCPCVLPDGSQCTASALTDWDGHRHPAGTRYVSRVTDDRADLVHPFE